MLKLNTCIEKIGMFHMSATLEQRSDGYFYASLEGSDGHCYLEYFYDTYLEAFKKWRDLTASI
jgi:hypothetical protein